MNQFTLNSLYENGIIDYIPDLYGNSTLPTDFSNPYLTTAMSGNLYKQAGMSDCFTPNTINPITNEINDDNKTDAIDNTKNDKNKFSSYIKGLLAAGIMVGATVMCFKKGKKPPVENTSKPGFFKRLFGKKHKIKQ